MAGAAHAQSFFEGFEPGPVTPGVAPIPAGWTSVNNSPGGPGLNPNWQVRNDGVVFPAFAGTTYAFANFNSSTGSNDISNYLISPLVVFNNGDTISFYTTTIAAPTFPDRLELVYNTTGSTLPADFTNVLLTVNPTLTTAGYPTTWTQLTATISGLSGPTSGRFAFHYNPTNGGPAGNNSDYIGVDDVLYNATGGGTLATNTSIGAGCYQSFASFYENFAAGTNDLSNTAWTLNNTGSGFAVIPGGSLNAVGSLSAATPLGLGDDTSVAAGTLGLTVHSNGFVSFGAGNGNGFTPTVATFLNDPDAAIRIWHDFNPAAAGSGLVQYEEAGSQAQITWDGVYDFGGSTPNTVQIQIDAASGDIVIAFGALSGGGNGYIVGYSPAGASLDPGSVDISASTLILTGATDLLPLALTATSRPVIGTNWNLALSNNTGFIPLIIIGVSDPMIADLAAATFGAINMPGCGLRASIDEISVGATLSLPLPNNPSLVGANIYANGADFQPGVNPFGFTSSNGIQGTIGDV